MPIFEPIEEILQKYEQPEPVEQNMPPPFDFIDSDPSEEKTELQQKLDALSVEYEQFHSNPHSNHIDEQVLVITLFSVIFLVFIVVRYRLLICSFFHRLFDFQKLSFDISFASRISLTRKEKNDDGPSETR